MKEKDFDRQVDRARRRLEKLARRRDASPQHQAVLQEISEQFSDTVQELQVASEELRQQNEELVSTRQALEDERRAYQQLFDLAPDAYLVTDHAGAIQQANHAAFKMFRVENHSYLIGKPFAVFVSKEDMKVYRAQMTRLAKEDSLQWEMAVHFPRTVPLPVAVHVVCTRDAKGKTVRLRWLLRDITQQHAAQQEIARLASFPELNPNPVVEMDLEGGLQYVNPAARGLFPDLRDRGLAHPYLAGLQLVISSMRKSGKSSGSREVCVGGRWYQQAVSFIPVISRVRIYALDIAERKAAEALIARRNALLSGMNRILETALVSKTDEDLGRACLTIAEGITGSAFGFIGEIGADGLLHDIAISDPGWADCKTADKAGHRRSPGNFKIHGLYGRVLKEGKSLLTNEPSSHADSIGMPEGHPGLQSFLGVPLLREGKVSGVIALGNRPGGFRSEDQEAAEALAPIILEALARKRAEAALKLANQELELRVQARTHELQNSNEQLRVEAAERQRAEKGVKAERQRLYDVLETLPVYVILLTPDYHVPFANRFFRERFGESRGRRCFEYLFGRTEPCENCHTFTVLKTHAPFQWEWTGPDGRNYSIYDFPFTDADGSPLILEMGIDVTELKRADTRARFTNDLLQLFVQTASRKEYLDAVAGLLHQWSGCRCMGIRVADAQRRIPYQSYIGFSREFWESENWLSLESDRCACTRIIAGKPEPQDAPAITPGGSFCLNNSFEFLQSLTEEQKARFRGRCIKSGFATIAIIPIRYRDQVLGAIHFVDEKPGKLPREKVEFVETMSPLIGEAVHRFNVEAEIRHMNEELERRVELRTTELKAANKEMESFSYSVSHDLRAPLRAIDGFSHMVLDGYSKLLDEDGRHMLDAIRGNAQRMSDLIDALLALSRLGRKQVEALPIEMGELAETAFAEVKVQHPDRPVQFQCHDLPPAQGDPVMIRQVFANLFSNAMKFSRTKEQTVVEVCGRIEEKEVVYLVKDNGVGFDMDHARKLFGAFQRLHREDEFEGIGIGLSLVQRIIHRHGGRVWAEGKVGEGATFYFTLPKAG